MGVKKAADVGVDVAELEKELEKVKAELRAELADREVEDQKQLSQLIDGFQPAVSPAPPALAVIIQVSSRQE